MPPIIEKIRTDYPGIQIEIVVSNEASNLKRRDADIAIRHFRPTQQDLIARKITDDAVWLYGTESYIATLNQREPAAREGDFSLIAYERSESNLAMLQEKGFNITLDNMPVVSQNYHMQMALVEQSLGLGIFTQQVGDANPKLIRAFAQFGPLTSVPLWLVCHSELHTSMPVRTVFDCLVEGLQTN